MIKKSTYGFTELELLIKQRDQIISNITELNKAFFTLIFGSISVVLTFFGLIISDSITFTYITTFFLIQFFIFLYALIYTILTSMNNNRDYIRAIDESVKQRYKIKVLFYQGQLSYKHINKLSSHYSIVTGIIAILFFAFILIVGSIFIQDILVFINTNIFITSFLIFELFIILFSLIQNMKYKYGGDSSFYRDCVNLLNKDIDII